MAQRLTQRSLSQLLAVVASRRPVPGGGSAAAAAAALGAALYVKVCRIILARRLSPIARRNAARIARACDRHCAALTRLVDLDAKAYGRLLEVWRSQGDRGMVRSAQRGALQAPLRICERARAALKETGALRRAAGGTLASDVEAGMALLVAGFTAAAAMVAVNLKTMGQGRRRHKGLSLRNGG